MVTFDAREPGTEPGRWDPLVAALPFLDVGAVERAVVVAPHPDDESLGAGGLLAVLAARGVETQVVIVTDGAASHPGAPDRGATVARRTAEVTAAVHLLAPHARLTLLGFPDGALDAHRDAVTAALRDVVGADAAGVLLVAPWRGDGHRDHRIVGEVSAQIAAAAGARLWEYPVWMWHWGTPEDPAVPATQLRALPLGDREVVLKHRAIRVHESQLYDPDGPPVLHAQFLRNADRDVEVFVVDEPDQAALPSEYFEALHERKVDPWGLADRWYEERKRAVTLSALPERDLGRVLEIGCSVGVLTAQLASRATEIVALDVSASAARRCRERLEADGLAGRARVLVASATEELPPGPFDVVVLSEVGYYLTRPELVALVARVPGVLAEGGAVVSCHWRHPVPEYPLGGDEVQAVIDRHLGLARLVEHVEEDFALAVHSGDPRSVARREGLA